MKLKTILILITVSFINFQVIAYTDNCSSIVAKKAQYLCYRYWVYNTGWPGHFMDLAQGVYVTWEQDKSTIGFKNGATISVPNRDLTYAWSAYTNFLINNPTFGTIE